MPFVMAVSLAAKEMRTCDFLLENVRGVKFDKRPGSATAAGYRYNLPGALTPAG